MTDFPDFSDSKNDITIPAQTVGALFTALGFTIAEIDNYVGKLTTQEFLNRVDWWLKNPSDNMPTLLLDEERLLQQYRNMLHISVHSARKGLNGLKDGQ